MRAKWLLIFGCALVLLPLVAQRSRGQIYDDNLPVDHPAIQYSSSILHDPVARLAARLDTGEVHLDFRENGLGYLPSVLEQLGVSSDSQALVFSKTSMQAAMISPRNPRAIYFTDDLAIGFVRGGAVLEAASVDPAQGVVFYTMETRKTDRPRFKRETVCLQCHQGPATAGVPGIFVSSVFPSLSGMPYPAGAIVTDHRTLFEDRWGGWYVNGTHGDQRHRGNAVAANPAEPQELETEGTQNLTSLVRRVDTSSYLSPVSDIVALMTFEHQTQMTNLLTRIGWQARIAQHDGKTDAAGIEAVVAYMLFAEEAPLAGPIEGVSTFTKTFAQRGPRDHKGRSLRDFDLKTRLFRYPLSYMVYSQAFDGLPVTVREQIYQRLYDVLTGKDQREKFARLSKQDRSAILEILRETKSGLPGYWKTQG
jgi:hypothetical protein